MKPGRQPRPSNWKIDKCIEYLLETPIPTLEVYDLDWIESELKEWKGIQEMVNESQQYEDDRILHHMWSMDIPCLRLYHTLIEHSILTEFRQRLQVQSHLEMPGILVQLGHTQRT